MINIDDKFLKKTPLAEGGEGIIYEYNDNIIKIYKNNVDKNEKYNKLQLLMNKNLPSNVIAPIDIVYNKNQFVGFMMKKVEGEEFKRLSNKKFIQINNIKSKDVLKMLVDIKNILITLHNQNIFISDLNDCNILFDKNYNVYFIDCDSWTIDNIQCTVCMDSFKDPHLTGNNFSSSTDSFAWATLIFKSLTKIHPFGGTMNPDMDILERMKNKISVIDNSKVTIPKTINKWTFISPKLLNELKEIFESNKRFLINQTLEDYYSNLKYCDKDNEYYYSKFNECPICNNLAKIVDKPVKMQNTTNGIPILLYFTNEFIKTLLSQDLYINNDNYATHIKTGNQVKCKNNYKYYFSDDGEIIYAISNKSIQIKTKSNVYAFDKINKSNVEVINDKVYYVNLNNNLIELNITESGNYTKVISKVSFNNLFEIADNKNYFICNIYDNMKIINISGYNYTFINTSKIVNYGIHFDSISKKWLFIFEDSKGKFTTMVFDKNNLIYQNDSIKYTNALGNLCFNNNVIFKPCDGAIKGFSYEKNIYKDFECNVVNEDSKIIKQGGKFIVINEKEIYKIG
jgi:serine/threonine protein kinase